MNLYLSIQTRPFRMYFEDSKLFVKLFSFLISITNSKTCFHWRICSFVLCLVKLGFDTSLKFDKAFPFIKKLMLFKNNSGKLHTSFHDPIKHFYTQSKIGYFIISANENHLTKYPCFCTFCQLCFLHQTFKFPFEVLSTFIAAHFLSQTNN